jgi:hypothetical protein
MARHEAATALLVGAGATVALLLGGCTTAPAPAPSGPSTAVPSTAGSTSASGGPTPPSASPSTGGVRPTEQSTPPTAAASPTYFSPTDGSGYSLSGRITVDAARQDPFSNLLMRGVLHDQPVTLDVVATPDQPVAPGVPGTVLLGTCRCDQRGAGLRVTVEDGAALVDGGNGDIVIRGSFRATMTARDAVTLSRVG